MKALQVNRWKRNKRIRQHLEAIISQRALFLTLTFTDEVLASTTQATRRKYVSRLLGAFKVPYIANIDFGDSKDYIDDKGNARKGTNREHYHAVIQLSKIDHKKWAYGNMDFKRVYNTNDLAMARYLTKLQYHAIKTPKRIIYPKLGTNNGQNVIVPGTSKNNPPLHLTGGKKKVIGKGGVPLYFLDATRSA